MVPVSSLSPPPNFKDSANSMSLEKVLVKETTDPAHTYHSAHSAFIIYLVQGSFKGQNQGIRCHNLGSIRMTLLCQ